MTNIVHYIIQLDYYSKKKKKNLKNIFQKKSKLNIELVKSYLVISLLNYMSRKVEKVVIKQLS